MKVSMFLIPVLFLLVLCQRKPDSPAENYLKELNPAHIYIWMEAENAREMAAESFVIVDDPAAFGEKYIEKPPGMLKLKFEVPADDMYKILGRAYTKDGNADSWKFLLINENGDTIIEDLWNNINTDRRLAWAWDEMTTGRTTSDKWYPHLEQGDYTLTFVARDADDCMLDKLLITNDTAFLPGETEESAGVYYQYAEAESGAMEAPFKTGKDNDTGDEFAWVEEANAVYEFQIDQPGRYRIWGYVRGENGHSDSVFGSVDDEPRSPWSFAKDGKWKKWKWIPYNTRNADSIVHEFDAGIHTITLNQREAGAKVDALMVTNDLDYVPENRDR